MTKSFLSILDYLMRVSYQERLQRNFLAEIDGRCTIFHVSVNNVSVNTYRLFGIIISCITHHTHVAKLLACYSIFAVCELPELKRLASVQLSLMVYSGIRKLRSARSHESRR